MGVDHFLYMAVSEVLWLVLLPTSELDVAPEYGEHVSGGALGERKRETHEQVLWNLFSQIA